MRQLQAALDIVTDAATEAGFLFAPVKSKAMWFLGLKPDANLHLDNLSVEWEDHFNYLGVVIDKHFRFHWHVRSPWITTTATSQVHKVSVEIDTGADCNVMPKYLFTKIFGSKQSESSIEYIEAMTNSSAKALKVLASISGVNCHILRRIFYATVWHCVSKVHTMMSQSQLNRLQMAQNAALWSCLGIP